MFPGRIRRILGFPAAGHDCRLERDGTVLIVVLKNHLGRGLGSGFWHFSGRQSVGPVLVDHLRDCGDDFSDFCRKLGHSVVAAVAIRLKSHLQNSGKDCGHCRPGAAAC